ARGEGDNGQADQTAKQRGKFRAEEDAGEGVGHGEGQAGEQRERQGLEAGLPASLLAEEARQHQHHQYRHQGAGQRVQNRHLIGDQLHEGLPARLLGDQLGADGGAVQAAVDADDDGRADRAEGHRGALHHHAEHDGGQRREADGDQQRRGNRGRGAEAGGALDKAAEQPGDNDGLNAAVGADGGETRTDRSDAARMLEGIEQQDGAEDDPQYTGGNHQALQGGGQDTVEAHVPDKQRDTDGKQEDQRHRASRGPAQADQQNGGEQDGREGAEGQQSVRHGQAPRATRELRPASVVVG